MKTYFNQDNHELVKAVQFNGMLKSLSENLKTSDNENLIMLNCQLHGNNKFIEFLDETNHQLRLNENDYLVLDQQNIYHSINSEQFNKLFKQNWLTKLINKFN